ncbi:MAG TPA: hypothetical protein VNN73_16010 [Blastocatellia bacterium]|nr:hypothetical protein [Blastocatellia bacterium]
MREWSRKKLRAGGDEQRNFGVGEARRKARDVSGQFALRFIAVFLMAAVGLGVGWLAGTGLSAAFAPKPTIEGATSQPVSQPVAPPPQPQPQPPVVKQSPPDDERNSDDGKDSTIEIPTDERSAKELGRKALKKLMKEIDKIGRDKHHDKHKDENEDWH